VNKPTSELYEFGEFRLDCGRRLLLQRDGRVVALTPKALDILIYLLEHRGVPVSKDDLMSAVWPDTVVEESNLSQNIYTLRRALGEDRGEHRYIATLPGRGYQFVAAVSSPENLQPVTRVRATRWLPTAALIVVVVGLAALTLIDRIRAEAVESIAVLPFKPLVASHRDESLEMGMAETLISSLSGIRRLTVRPLGVVRGYNSLNQDPMAAGRDLGVDAVLDGHIQRVGDRVRVTARLFEVRKGKHLWTGQFDEKFTDIFSVQDAIARRVIAELALELTGTDQQRLTHRSTVDARAYELYLKGRFFISLAQPQRAIEVLEEAVRIDPDFALAHAGLADIYSRLPIATGAPSEQAIRRAKEASRRAFEIDSELAEAFAAQGWIEFYYEWNWRRSEEAFRRALALRPDDFSANLGYAHLLSNTMRHGEALARIDHAIRVDPQSPIAHALKGQFLFHARRYEEARTHLASTVRAHPAFWIAHVLDARALSRLGRYEEALAALSKAMISDPTTTTQAVIAVVHGEGGQQVKARETLRDLQERTGSGRASPYSIALVYQALGDVAGALVWLGRARDEKDVRLVFLAVDPLWDSARTDARFIAVLDSLDLPDAHAAAQSSRTMR
jgi:DNA-binding winged helix-turn-helix (wHTH) protein/TolB-like protein